MGFDVFPSEKFKKEARRLIKKYPSLKEELRGLGELLILKGNRRVIADTALRLAKYFGTSAKFWLGLQDDYDLEEVGLNKKSE